MTGKERMHSVVVPASFTEPVQADLAFKPSWGHLAAYAVLYFVAAGLGQWPTLAPGLTATVWVPGGLTFGLLLFIDKRHWGHLAAAALSADIAAEMYFYRFGLIAGAVIALGNVLEPLIGATLVRWWCGTPFHLRGVRNVLGLALFAGFASPMISATMGATTLKMTGIQDFIPAWLLWWLGDGIGVLIVAPLVIATLQLKSSKAISTHWRAWEAIGLLVLLLGSSYVFATGKIPVSFIVLPPLLWAALRFGIGGAALTVAFLCAMTLICISAGFHPFARAGISPFWQTVFTQTFFAVASISTLLLAALSEQRDRAVEALTSLAGVLDQRVNEQTSILRQNEQLLTLALESAGAAEWNWDIVRNQLSWSQRYRALYGFDEDKPGGLDTWLARIHPDDLERVERRIRTMLATPGDDVWREEFRIVHPNRGILWLGGAGRVTRDSNGRALQITGINYDITEHRRAEVQLRLQQEAQARLSRLGAVAGLTAGIAHEINQPLMAARTYARVTVESLKLPTPMLNEARQSAEKVVAQVERAGEVLRRLREFIRFGRTSIEAVELTTIIEAALTLMEPEIERGGIMIHREIDAALPKVMGDTIQVEQVLINLLRNSIDALRETRSLDGKIALRCRQSGEEYVEICISDNGPGFSPELQSGAPQPFMTTKLDGLGFGLSFSRSIIEAHGGRLWVGQDRPGAAVYFTLPLAREASA